MSAWALVTGSSKGIGRAVAVALAGQGASVLVHYGSDREGALATAGSCRAAGGEAEVVGADLAGSHEPVEEAVRAVGGVHTLVNCAGTTRDGLAVSMSDEDFALTLEVNLVAAFRLSRMVLPAMLRVRRGRIVNVASVVGMVGNAGQANYAASKGGLIALTRTLAREVGRRGITVNAVAPGLIRTRMTAGLAEEELLARVPARRSGTPEEVASVVAYLCSPGAGYVNGAVVPVDGGMSA